MINLILKYIHSNHNKRHFFLKFNNIINCGAFFKTTQKDWLFVWIIKCNTNTVDS